MKIMELEQTSPTIEELLRAVQRDLVVLLRDGKPLARIEKVSDDDWEELQYESSPEALERGRRGREQYARGEYLTLDELKEQHGLVE